MKGYEAYIALFEKHLMQQEFDHKPIELYQPILYTLSLPGKRIRPVLTLMACELFSGSCDAALPQALAIELFHNFTLIHDDIMDDAPIRRGKETVFRKWNANIAILSGDTLFALAYQYAMQAKKEILPDILRVFNNTAIEVCEGQQYDLNYETNNEVTVDQYIEMIRLKTAVLFGASLKIGALMGGASSEDAISLYNFGLNIGLGFQLKDDLLDTFGDEHVFGKKTGGDILTNKKTYLYLHTLEVAEKKDSALLKMLYNTPTESSKEKIDQVIDIFKKVKAYAAANKEIDRYIEKGMLSLNNVNVSEEAKDKLRVVAHKMINRDK